MNTWMYVVREMEDAIDDCQTDCANTLSCNDDPVHAWDEAVAFYTGSLEGSNGQGTGAPTFTGHTAGKGAMIYNLADKRCSNFMTCGAGGDALSGTAKNNIDIFDQFALGQHKLLTGQCAAARANTERIVDLMTVPLIQGTLRYAYHVKFLSGAEKEKAEGAVFAAAVLPRLHHCSAAAATTVYNNMRIGLGNDIDYVGVKAAFEANYACLNITCVDIGGYYFGASNAYYDGAAPCVDTTTTPPMSNGGDDDDGLAVGIIVGISVACSVAALLCVALGLLVTKEKQGTPIFTSISQNGGKVSEV